LESAARRTLKNATALRAGSNFDSFCGLVGYRDLLRNQGIWPAHFTQAFEDAAT
jgi:hypothetical protein